MTIYQNRKGEISMLNITIPVLNEFQAGWIVCQNKVNQIFKKNQATNLLIRLKHISSKDKTKHFLAGSSLMNGLSIPGTHPIRCHHGSCIFFLKYNSLRPSHPDSWEENSRHLISLKHWNENNKFLPCILCLYYNFPTIAWSSEHLLIWNSAWYITKGKHDTWGETYELVPAEI